MKREVIKLKEVWGPTPFCPHCKKVHLIKRLTIIGSIVYDCPQCQSVYEEEK